MSRIDSEMGGGAGGAGGDHGLQSVPTGAGGPRAAHPRARVPLGGAGPTAISSTRSPAGRFREDLYYRICADPHRHADPCASSWPTIPNDLAQSPIGIVARRVGGPVQAQWLAGKVQRWIVDELGIDYAWPGNIRELEQCVRNVLVHGEYPPPPPRRAARAGRRRRACRRSSVPPRSSRRRAAAALPSSSVYADAGNLQEAARRLGMDWRTVRTKLDVRSDRKQRADLWRCVLTLQGPAPSAPVETRTHRSIQQGADATSPSNFRTRAG